MIARRCFAAVACLVLCPLVACEAARPFECDEGTPVRLPDGGAACARPDAAVDADVAAVDAGERDGGRMTEDAAVVRDAGARDEVEESPDAPDCMRSWQCPNHGDLPLLDLRTAEEARFLGRIDGAAHRIQNLICDREVEVGDRDVIWVRAPVRSMIEATLSRQLPDGSLTPVVDAVDMDSRWIITGATGEREARIEWIAPNVFEAPMPIMIQHLPNIGDSCATSPLPREGGPGYAYVLHLRRRPFAPIELGTLGSTPLTRDGEELGRQGDMRIYRFEVPDGARAVAELTLTACPAELADRCYPILVPLDVTGGQALYSNPNRPPGDDRTRERGDWGTYRGVEHLFAVYDYEGRGAPGYRVDVRVSAQP